MQVMVLEQDQGFQAQLATALMEKGFHVICVESQGAAEHFIRLNIVDVLVLGERIGGRLSHPVALLAECRNPVVSTILLTERKGPELDEVFELLPSVYAILGRGIAPHVVAQMVVSAMSGLASDVVRSRLGAQMTQPDMDFADDAAEDPDEANFDEAYSPFEEDETVPEIMALPEPPPAALQEPPATPQSALAALAERLRASPVKRGEWWTAPEGTLADRRIRALPALEDLTPLAGGGTAGDRRLHLQ